MSCNLTTKLASDGTASSGNHNRLAGHIPHDALHLGVHRISSQQVLNLHIAELGYADFPIDQLINTRKYFQLAAGLAADIENLLHRGPGCRRNGNHDLVNVIFFCQSADIVPVSCHQYPAEIFSPFARIIIHQAADILPDKLAVLNLF